VTQCGRDFSDVAEARAYATCVDGLSCSAIDESFNMDLGPLGYCFSRARRH
jgi:hypothetical protein